MHELMPKTLTHAARTLGVDPFEVVRMLVASGRSREHFHFYDDDIESLRLYGGIETWWSGTPRRQDNESRGGHLIRTVLQALLDRELVGERQTRIDNLWRGLDPQDQDLVEDAVEALCELEWLQTHASPSGIRISIHGDAVDRLRQIADGSATPTELEHLWSR